jgi:hypothetical protein
VRLLPHTAQALLSNRSRVICHNLGSGPEIGRENSNTALYFNAL